MPMTEPAFVTYFADLPDPRVDRAKTHTLSDILGVALCAVICGADSFEEIERFGNARVEWLKRLFPLPNGIPSHDTFNRVLAALDRKAFAACFGRWMADLGPAAGLKPIAIDGKACRSAPGDTFSGCLHLVSAWATEDGLILGQEAVADGSHEFAAIPALLKALDLVRAVVTLDAAGCQTEIFGQIRERGGDYVGRGEGEPAGAGGGGLRGVRPGVRGRVRGAPEARGGGGRTRTARGAVRDDGPRPPRGFRTGGRTCGRWSSWLGSVR